MDDDEHERIAGVEIGAVEFGGVGAEEVAGCCVALSGVKEFD